MLPAWPGTLTAWLTCLGRVFPSRGRWGPAWEAEEAAGLPPSSWERGVTSLPATWEAWEAWLPATKLLPSLGGRWEPAWLPAWDKLLAPPEGRWAPAWEVTDWLPAWVTLLPYPRERRAPAGLPAWDKLLPSPKGRWAPAWLHAWEKLLPSPRRRWVPAWDKLLASPGGKKSACLGSNYLTVCLT